MRIADRLARLETRSGADDRMTPAEIEMAATSFAERITAAASLPADMTRDQAMATWCTLVASPIPSWWQRVFAIAEPEDWFV